MKRYSKMILLTLIITIFLTKPVISQDTEQITDIKVKKNVIEVTNSGWILIDLEITNLGDIPLYEIEIYEYYIELFDIGKNITIIYNEVQVLEKMPSASGGQFILPIYQIEQLQSNEVLKIRYWTRSFESGDFRIPQSLVWYSFDYNDNNLRQNMYSNGLIVHIRSDIENIVTDIFPYVMAGLTFVTAIIVLRYIRKNFGSIITERKKPGIFR